MAGSAASSAQDSRRSWTIYLIAVSIYVVAIVQRSSFGMAGLEAAERFDAGASIVSLFVVVQLLTYSGMQIPAGLMADRFGSRIMLGTGAAIMAVGQLDLAFAQTLPAAIVARILVGMGDAMTFTSVIKLLPTWFRHRRIPMLVQSLTMFGQLGQLISSIPLAAVLRISGWTSAFALTAGAGVAACLAAWLALRDRPRAPAETVAEASSEAAMSSTPEPSQPAHRGLVSTVRLVWSNPGTRLGFFLHALGGFPGLVFAMMWGYPFLEDGVGLPTSQISALFTVLVIGGLIAGPIVGVVSPRHPLRLSNITISIAVLNLVVLLALLSFDRPPMWMLVIWVLALSTNAAGSNVGFEVARAHNSLNHLATATSIVIMGAFSFSVVGMWLAGVVLDHFGDYSMASWRWAWASLLLVYAIALTGVYTQRPLVRAKLAAEGTIVPSWRSALGRELTRFRAGRED